MTPLRVVLAVSTLLLASRLLAEERAPANAFIPVPYVFYTPETSLSGGVILMVVSTPGDSDRRESVYRGGGFVSVNGQAEGFAGMEYYSPGNRLRLNVDGFAARYPNKFFGIGPDAGSEEDYVPFECALDATAGFSLAPDLYVGPRLRLFGSWMQERAPGGALLQGGVAGSDGTGLVGPGLRLTWDTRDSSVAPRGGFYVDLSGSWSFVTFRGSSYPSVVVDARAFHSPFPDRKVVLAGQLYGAWAGGAPPFQELPRLGGDELLRGYYDGRYRDNALLAAQAEIRIPVWWRFGVALFGGAGLVAGDPLSFRFDRTRLSGGIGLRFVLEEESGASFRADVALSEDGVDFYFNLGEAF
jgi:hypothetical protein